jgi:hypothetical protein
MHNPTIKPVGWLPIETAPRDGEKVLVGAVGYVDAAYWDYEDWCAPHSSASCLPYTPTHWMPLPEPPLLAGAGPNV